MLFILQAYNKCDRYDIVICPWGFWVPFCGSKESESLSTTFEFFEVSFCLSVNVDTSRISCLILSYLDNLTLPWSLLQGDWWRFKGHAQLFNHVWCKDWIWNWLPITVRKVMQEEGLPGRPPKAHNTGDDSLCCTDTVQLQQLIMWKENITILFFLMAEGENFLQVRSCFQQTRGFYPMEKAGGGNFEI